jgi:mRNA interferase RelE/StbE
VSPGYTVSAIPAVDKDLDRLSRQTQSRLLDRMEALAQNPRPSGARAIAGRPGYFRVRVGDYRIVYGVDDTARTVTVVIVGRRDDVYDRMERRI